MDKHAWLEDVNSADTKKFYEAHNKTTDAYFVDSKIDYFAEKIAKIGEADLRSLSSTYGKYKFWVERRADWQKIKLIVQKKNGKEVVLLDFEDSELALDYWFPSPDGTKLIFGTSLAGNEATTLRIINVETGLTLKDEIAFSGFTDQGDICWITGSTFVYPRMNGFDEKGERDKWLLGSKLYLHRIGDDPKIDKLIYGSELPDTVMLIPTLSSSEQKLYVASCEDELTHQISVVELLTQKYVPLTSSEKASFIIKTGKGKVYALTNYKAPRYRLLMCDETDVELRFDDWDEVLPESENVLQEFWIHKSGSIVAKYSHNVASRLNIYDAYGNQTEIISLPEFSIVQGLVCSPKQQFISISVSGYTLPTTHYQLSDTSSRLETIWQREPLDSDSDIEVNQYWAESKDGVKIPYFYICTKDSISKPCIVYGYGGFNIAIEPSYLTNMRPWILAGGSVAIANLRGGSEFGENWHIGGSMENKQNTFNDCIAVAEDITKKGLSNTETLGLMGGSNGGLLVAAVTLQKPDLFRAGAALVPLTDMLEFYKHQVAEFWVHEYGDPRIAEQANWIKKWSPYHYPIDSELKYPALYYETALHDARVSPFHALKMVARLETEINVSKGPLLLRTMTDTGHQSSNLTKLESARRTAEYYAFFASELGLD